MDQIRANLPAGLLTGENEDQLNLDFTYSSFEIPNLSHTDPSTPFNGVSATEALAQMTAFISNTSGEGIDMSQYDMNDEADVVLYLIATIGADKGKWRLD